MCRKCYRMGCMPQAAVLPCLITCQTLAVSANESYARLFGKIPLDDDNKIPLDDHFPRHYSFLRRKKGASEKS